MLIKELVNLILMIFWPTRKLRAKYETHPRLPTLVFTSLFYFLGF